MDSTRKKPHTAMGQRIRPRLDLPPRGPAGSASGPAKMMATSWRQKALRAIDVIIATLALILLSPLILLIAVVVKLDSPGPVIYRQLRIGLDRRCRVNSFNGRRVVDLGGSPFMIHKFRTMRANAEHRTGPVWAAPDDLRTTRVGRFLRSYRLDEIPQFWDVLRGDMSVVGPRPERPNFVGKLRKEIAEYSLRHRVRPGITGWAQVNQGYDGTLDDVRAKLEYDLEYVRRKSLWFDVRIMLKTVPVMLMREGSEPLTARESEQDTYLTVEHGPEV
jgi:lipopolysaccharide/colanic/teichoic acid biosynthesis glycosyltransferase